MQNAATSGPDLKTITLSEAELVNTARQSVVSARWSANFEKLFPSKRLGKADYILGSVFIAACFVLFFHVDMWGAGWDSLNYIFGHPLDFYENCKRIRGGGQNMVGTPYPPTIYVIFAFWLYPLKLLKLLSGPETFPHPLTYWLKVLTTLAYLGSAAVFYRISLEYSRNRESAKYAAAAWLTMPLALFSEFIFSQYDIFYVLLTLAGFLMFLRRRLAMASLYFGVAITFKYFPAFVFLPLLFFYEKRIYRIAIYCLIFLFPTLLIDLMYGHSPAFVEGVLHHSAIDRIYAATIDSGFMGYWGVYTLPASVAVLCGISYFAEPSDETHMTTAAFLWLVSSIMPFLLIIWHPQWVMFFAAPIILTSMLSRQREKLLVLDIVGMFLFVATVVLIFRDNVDAVMFQGAMFGFDFENAYLMAQLFEWFGTRSLDVFYSGFCAYLVLQIVLKYRLLVREETVITPIAVNYDNVRRNLYIGLMIFIIPASFAIYKDMTGHLHVVQNQDYPTLDDFGELAGEKPFEQTFVAEGRTIEYLALGMKTSAHAIGTSFLVEILDANGHKIAQSKETVTTSSQWLNHDIRFESIPVLKDAQYKIRLTSPGYAHESDITWLATPADSYKSGHAVVDGVSRNSDFLFRIVFAK